MAGRSGQHRPRRVVGGAVVLRVLGGGLLLWWRFSVELGLWFCACWAQG